MTGHHNSKASKAHGPLVSLCEGSNVLSGAVLYSHKGRAGANETLSQVHVHKSNCVFLLLVSMRRYTRKI